MEDTGNKRLVDDVTMNVQGLTITIIRHLLPRNRLLAGLILIVLLVGCAPSSGKEQNQPITVDTVRIIYSREGGFAGASQEWIIYLDGAIDAPGGQRLLVPPEDVRTFVETGLEADIDKLAASAATPDACCDQFIYTLTFSLGEQQWQLVTTDSTVQPQEVADLFSMAESLIAEAESTR